MTGKPLYRKLYTGYSLPTSGEKRAEINISDLNISRGFIDVTHSYFHDTTNGRYYPPVVTNVSTGSVQTANSSAQSGMYFNNTYTRIIVEGGYSFNWTATICIEYTKKTD